MTLDPTDPRDDIVAAGLQRLLGHGIDGLRALLNASALSRDSSFSRDTAYRVFRDDHRVDGVTDAIIAAVAAATNDWSEGGYDAALGQAMAAYQASATGGADAETSVIASLEAVFEAQFRSPSLPVGFLLGAAALTASPAWQGAPAPAGDVDVGRAVLDIRRVFYERRAEQLVVLAHIVMSELGRRPRVDVDPGEVVVLTHALLDGCILRRLIAPDAVPASLFAQGLFRLWMAFSEPGTHDDPRRPGDQRDRRTFDLLLDGAAELWRAEVPSLPKPLPLPVTVEAAAGRAAVPVDVATRLFPGVGDLADSLLRARVVGGGFVDVSADPDVTEARQHVLVLVSQLQRLRDLADSLPRAVAAARSHPPVGSRSIFDDLVDNHSRVVEVLKLASHPRDLVEDLVRFAAQGTSGWESVTALLKTIGYRQDRP